MRSSFERCLGQIHNTSFCGDFDFNASKQVLCLPLNGPKNFTTE